MADAPRLTLSPDPPDAVVLARISAGRMAGWRTRERAEACEWARANGIDPNGVSARHDVEVFLLDCPAIRRHEFVLTDDGSEQLSCRTPPGRVMHHDKGGHTDCTILTRVVVTPLVVPLPAHLADPT